MSLVLHYCPQSRAVRIAWLLHELELDFDINIMPFHPSALKSDEHRQRHPLGRVPVLEDGPVTLFESGAIVEYLLSHYGEGRLRPEQDDDMFPEYLKWLHFCEGTIMPPINTIIVQTVLLSPERRKPDVLQQAQKLLAKTLAPLNQVLRDRPFLAGAFTGADIMSGHAAYTARTLGCVSSELTELQAYLDGLKARPAFKKALAISG